MEVLNENLSIVTREGEPESRRAGREREREREGEGKREVCWWVGGHSQEKRRTVYSQKTNECRSVSTTHYFA